MSRVCGLAWGRGQGRNRRRAEKRWEVRTVAEPGLGVNRALGRMTAPHPTPREICLYLILRTCECNIWGKSSLQMSLSWGLELPSHKCPCESQAEGYLAQARRHREESRRQSEVETGILLPRVKKGQLLQT